MDGMRTWIIAVIALIVGAVGGYVYMQGQASDLAQQVSGLQAQLTEATGKAGSAASDMEALKAELAAKTKTIEEQQARIAELEAAAQQPMAPAQQQ